MILNTAIEIVPTQGESLNPALIKKWSNEDLHTRLTQTSQRERELTALMITLIEEADRRRLYYGFGHKSLFDYITCELGYSASAAMRRISSARLSREIPEIKDKVLEGALSLSHLAQAQQYFRSEASLSKPLDVEAKRQVIKKLEGTSAREAEKMLAGLSSQPQQFLKPDRVQTVTAEISQISFQADQKFLLLLEEAKGLLAHRMPEATLGQVIAELMKIGVEGLRKQKFKVRLQDHTERDAQVREERQKRTPQKTQEKTLEKVHEEIFEKEHEEEHEEKYESEKKKFKEHHQKPRSNHEDPSKLKNTVSKNPTDVGTRSAISAEVSRKIFQRDEGRCAVIDPKTGKRCGSYFKIELDHHPIPKAMGGPDTVENLRLACRACNISHAVQRFGQDKVFRVKAKASD